MVEIRREGPDPPSRQDALLAAAVRSAHDAIVLIGRDLDILDLNDGAVALFGYEPGDLIGRSIDVLIPDDGRGDEREILSLVAAGGRLDRFRTRRIHRDGHPIDVSVAVSPLIDRRGAMLGLTTISRRISERERLEVIFQGLMEAAPDAVLGVADDDRVVLANTQAERLFGLTRHGLIGQPIAKLISTPLPAGPAPAAPATENGPAPTALARRDDGGTVPVEISVSPLDTGYGRVRCAVIRDITERLRAQDEYVRLRGEAERGQLEARLHRAQRLESLGQLAGGIAHDFNNLIGVMVNYAEFIAEEATGAGLPGIAADAEQISRAGHRGAELTHQLLAFARREVARPRPLDLNLAVEEVAPMLRRAIGEHITLVPRLVADPGTVTADPGTVEQVLVNLAVNARDAMPDGGTLSIETDTVDLDADYASTRPPLRPGRHVRLRISDTGTGMPREVIERAIEPFFTTKPAGQGTGLGLATVYGIVTAAGGNLSVYSEPGLGTTMTILLPVTDQPVTVVTPDPPATALGGDETILLVEDEPAIRQLTHRVLTGVGYQVLTADDGTDAVHAAERHPGPIHLLLTDVVMPNMLGNHLAERLTTARPGIRVLYMSGYAQPVLASHGTLPPDVMLLEKPFTKAQLLAAVRTGLAGTGLATRDSDTSTV